jgi:chemotaxis protein histidine kinase CheA
MNGLWMLLGFALGQAPEPTPHQAYAKGLELANQEQRAASAREFESVRAMTLGVAQGELRRAAVYNLGTLELQEGERWRAQLPEIKKDAPAGALPLPPTPAPAPAAGASGGAKEEDPLAKARQHYTAARKHFIERLRIDWKDADTRANAELVTRRLAQLDRIEQERKKQQQEQQQDQQDKKQQDKQDKQPKEPENKDQEPREKPEEGQPDADQKQEPKPEDSKPQDDPKDKAQPEPKPEQGEKELSKEEMVQLLDRLQKIEEQAQKLKAQMREARRTAVKKDW